MAIRIFAVLVMGLLLTACDVTSSSTNQGSTVREIDRLKTARPALVCGKAGYEYLLKEYFGPQCAACHTRSGPFDPPMSDPDINISYSGALGISAAVMEDSVLSNSFCGEECSLTEEGEVYQAVVEWMANRFSCP